MGSCNPEIKCKLCGYSFKTKSHIVTHYHDYTEYEEEEWYPCEKGEYAAHRFNGYICDKCYQNISKILIDKVIQDGEKYIATREKKVAKIQEEWRRKIQELDYNYMDITGACAELKKVTNLSNLSEDLYSRLKKHNPVLYHVYYLEDAMFLEKEKEKTKRLTEKLSIKDLCALNAIDSIVLPTNYSLNSLVTRVEFLNILKQSSIKGMSFNDLTTLFEKLALELKD